MGARFLTDLADVCRATGWPVVEVEGWQTRARGSGGYNPGFPSHVAVHHTASGPSSDGWPDVNYICFGDDDAPLANLYLDRDGTIFVCAAGATNTNGSGDCPHLPSDTLNTSAIGIEAGNDGTGEPWPTAQQDAYVAVCRALCRAYGIPVAHVEAHHEWTGRKVDPAGPSRYSGGGSWDMAHFRADCAEEADDVTDQDIQRIAAAVWEHLVRNHLDGTEQPAGAMLGYAHLEAGSVWTAQVHNFVADQDQPAAALLGFTHSEAYDAAHKGD